MAVLSLCHSALLPSTGLTSFRQAAARNLSNDSRSESAHQFDFRFLLAGGIAGGVTNAVVHPIDTLKTVRQASVSSGKSTPLLKSPNPALEMIRTIRSAGLRNLYAGFWPAVFGAIPSSAVYFGSYETAKRVLAVRMPSSVSRSCINMMAAASGNIASSVIFVPKEAIKQQLQAISSEAIPSIATSTGGAVTALHVVQHMYKSSGWKGFFPSYRATLLRNIPSASVKFTVYEELKLLVNRRFTDPERRSVGYLIAGAASSALSSTITTPIDVVKTRIATGVIPRGTGIAPAIINIMRTEGLVGLFAGRGERLLLSALFGGVGFVSFEWSKAALGIRPLEHLTTKE